MNDASLRIYATMGLDHFVDAMYKHYANLPSLGDMDQWALNKAINAVREAPIEEIEEGWSLKFLPMDVWIQKNSKDYLEIIPLTLKSSGKAHAKVCEILRRVGVDDNDVEKLMILGLMDRIYHDEEGKIDPEIVMLDMYDPQKEHVKLQLYNMDLQDDGSDMTTSFLKDSMKKVDELVVFCDKKKAFSKIFHNAQFHVNLKRREPDCLSLVVATKITN